MPLEIDVRKNEDRQVTAVRFTADLRLQPSANGLKIVDNAGVSIISLAKAQADNLVEAIAVAKKFWPDA